MIKLLSTSAASLLLWAAMPAGASEPLPTAVDPDQDGTITRTEFLNLRNTRAFSNDANGDGLLSQDEFSPMMPSRVPARMHGRVFNQFDTDQDGSIDMGEMTSSPARAFDQADANGDNVISGDEIHSFRTQLENAGLYPEQ